MRPKGSKSKSYKTRNNLTYKKIRLLITDYSSMSNSDILKKYNIGRGQLRNIRIDYKLKTKNIAEVLMNARRIDLQSVEVLCGVYGILRSDGLKMYIGSSINVVNRIKSHLSELKSGGHYNKTLQVDSEKYSFVFYIIKECSEADLINTENNFINRFDTYVLYNKNFSADHDVDYKMLFEKIKSKTLTVNECWEWQGGIHKTGYGVLISKGKHFFTHRLIFRYYYDFTPTMVGHICNNKKCCNPEHLKETTARENNQYRYDSECPLTRSACYPYLDQVKEMLKEGIFMKDIYKKLNCGLSYGAIYQFCKKVKTIYAISFQKF